MIAANSASSSSYDVRMSALIDGSTARTARHTSMPEPSGSRASRTATSRPQRRDPRGRLGGGGGLADDLDVLGALEQEAQPFAHDVVVVEQVHADRVGHARLSTPYRRSGV